MTTHTTIGKQLGSTSLATEQTYPTQTKVSQLEMAVLVNEQVVGLEITVSSYFSTRHRTTRGMTYR